MFHPSPQHVFLTQQVISLNQAYPCPRCPSGMMEPFGVTETLQCTSCKRSFVPLRGSRLLFPAKNMGWKIAPTFWWDGLRWHWAGTTATPKQICVTLLLILLPIMAINGAILANIWPSRPDWCNPFLLTPLIGLAMVQIIYVACWDFDFLHQKEKSRQSSVPIDK